MLHETRRGVAEVVACSAEATVLGISPGMPLAEVAAIPSATSNFPGEQGSAKRVQGSGFRVQTGKFTANAHGQRPVGEQLVGKTPMATPQPAILPYDPPADREALETLAERCGRFSPMVAMEDAATPDSLLLDVTGLAHLFGGEISLAEKIVEDFHCNGLIARVAIADTIGTAWAVAHFSSSWGRPSSSFLVVPPGESLAALRPLPIEALRLPEKVVDLLHQLGVDRIEQLEALPRRELSSRFGPELLRRWDQAIGRLAEPVPAHQPTPEFRADWSPPQPTARKETIEAALEQLIRQVVATLIRSDRGVVRLECRLDGSGALPEDLTVGLFEPSVSAKHLFQLVQLHLERVRLRAPVSAVHVAAAVTAPLIHRQQAMFFCGDGNDSSRQRSRQLAALVDRLSSRLGRRAVVRARIVSDAQPELAWQRDPLLQGLRRRRRRKSLPADLPPRPLRLLRRPIALPATSIVPDGPPLRFHLGRHEHEVTHTWGPERIETGWWRGRTVGRDYYRIETATGRRFWLFRRLRDGRWFLHGTYE